MATPDLLDAASMTPAVLVQAQLASGNTDFTVPANRAWVIKSLTLTNVSGATVTVDMWVVPASGGTARAVLDDEAIPANTTLSLDPAFLALLPENAVLRIGASAGSAIDVLATGVIVQ